MDRSSIHLRTLMHTMLFRLTIGNYKISLTSIVVYKFLRSFDSNPNMAFVPGMPVDMAKHRGHPLKSFSIPAPPSNTPMIPGQKPGNKTYKIY